MCRAPSCETRAASLAFYADRPDPLTTGGRAVKIERMEKLVDTSRPDQLTDLLLSVRFHGTVFCRSELSAPWGFAVARRQLAAFHLVTRGNCCLDVEGISERFWLSEGDLVILPTGNAHTVRDAPTSAATFLDQLVAENAVDHGGTLPTGGGGAQAVVVCGGAAASRHTRGWRVAALPPPHT